MALDLGNLTAGIEIDARRAVATLTDFERKVDDTTRALDNLDGKKVDVKPTGQRELDTATRSTEKLGDAADTAATKSTRIKFPTQYTADADKAKTAIDGAVDSLGKLAWNAGKWGAATAATTAIAGIGTALTKGWGRLTAIDNAEAKLEALGNSGVAVQQVMDNALASVKGTAFGIGDAAGTAAVLVGAGVKPGQELERTLKLVADSAAIAGIGFNEMGSIWGKVASNTVLSGEEMAQISDRSIGLQVALAEKYGVTAQEAKKMVSEGKVSFQDFSDAMETLVGGGAVRMGETVSGAMDNVGAAMGRFGAEALRGMFQGTPALLQEVTAQFDAATGAVGPFAESITAQLMPAAEGLVKGIGPGIVASMNMISDLTSATAPAIGGLTSAMDAVPFPVWAGGIATLIGQHKGWTAKLDEGSGKVADFGSKSIDAFGRMFTTFGQGYDRGSANLRSLAGEYDKSAQAAKIASVKTGDAFTSIDQMGQSAARGFQANTLHMAASAKGLATGGLDVMKDGFNGAKSAAGNLVNALGGPWAIAIGAAGLAVGYLVEQHYAAAQAEIEHRAAQAELKGTLEGTTGAITEQTRELQLKRAEESGWLETATELGLSHNTLIDAMNGNEHAQRRVNQAVAAGTTAAVEASDAWAKNGQHFIDAGIGANTLAAALNGDVDAMREVNEAAAGYSTNFGPGMKSMLNEIGHEVGGTTDAFGDLADGVGQASADLADLQVQIAKEELEALQVQAETTRGALDLLGDVDLKIEDAGTISLAFDDVSQDTLDKLEEVHNITSRTIDGRVHLTFPDGADILAVLDTMGIKLESLENGTIRVQADDLEGAKALLEELGILANIDGGELFVDTNAQAVIDMLVELGILAADPKTGEVDINADSITDSETKMERLREVVGEGADGDVRITDNTDQVNKNVDAARANTERGAKGEHVIKDNAQDVWRNVRQNLDGKVTYGRHVVTTENRVIMQESARSSGGRGYTTPYADGGIREQHVAQIARAGEWRLWAEPETGGEAYIPLAESKRPRSEMILAEVARMFGHILLPEDVLAFANGGILSAAEIKDALSHMDNGQYVMGGFSTRQTDCSGGVSAAVNTALGLPTFESRMSTVTIGQWLAAKGFEPGRGDDDDIVVGWYDYGGGAAGHTSMRLQDGTFIESGGNTGQGFTIGGAAGGLDGRGYTNFMHLPYDSTAEGEGGFLTGDDGARTSMGSRVDYRAEFDGVDIQDGLSGVGSTAGRAFNVPGLASNVSNRTVGQSLGGAAGQISGAAGRAGYAGEANALMGMRNPFAGEGTWRGLLGDELSEQITTLSTQLEEQTGRHGIAAEVEAALDGHTPNWDVWLKVSPETIEAFNKLGEAKADRENAAYDVKEAEEALTEARKNVGKTTEDEADRLTKATEKVTDAEKELAKAREGGDAEKIEKAERKLRDAEKSRADDIEKQAEGTSKAADDVAKAEMNLVKAREKEQRAIADLERAHAEYSIAMAVAPVNALMELTSGIVEGTKALADAFERLDDVIQATNEVVVRHEEAQIRSAEATHGAVKAQHALTRSERASRRQQHTDILAVQQAEWDLAMARHEASRTAGAAEVDLSQVRQQGIWDVFQTSQQADQAAIMSAQQVALMEAHLSMVKAEAAVREQQASYDQQIAMIELEFAQREAEVQAQYLAIATAELAMIQGEAAGIAGYGASAMAKKTEGTAKKQSGIFGLLGSLVKGIAGVALAPATGGSSLLLTLQSVAEGIGHVGNIASGRAQEKAYAEEAKREFDALPKDIQQMIVAQQAGIPLAAAAGALMGAAGGSRDDVATVQQAVQGAFSVGLDIAIAKAQAALQAAEAKRLREERELAAQERQNRLDELNARLEADLENFDKEDTLAEILEVARQQYQELLQENKQLGELNKNLAPKNQAVLMQLGGSQWGDGSGPTMDVGRGFAGLTAGMLDPYGSAGMEDQWLDAASRSRMVAPWLPSEEEWLSGGVVEGLPETVADGLYAAAEGAVSAALSGAQGAESLTTEQVAQIVAETVRIVQESGSTTQVGTQFTGDVTIQGAQATDTITALAEQLAKA